MKWQLRKSISQKFDDIFDSEKKIHFIIIYFGFNRNMYLFVFHLINAILNAISSNTFMYFYHLNIGI